MIKAGAALAAVVVGLAMGTAIPGAAFASINPNSLVIENGLSGLYLEPKGDKHTAGTVVVQQEAADNSYQGWFIQSDGNGFDLIESDGGGAGNIAIGINGASRSSGAQAIVAPNTDAANQRWILTSAAGGNSHIHLKNANSGLCLGITNASVVPGVAAAQFTCSSAENQIWIDFKASFR